MNKFWKYLLFVLLLTSVQNLFAFCGIEVDRVSDATVLNSKAKALKGTDRKFDFTDVLSKKGIVTEIAFYSPKIVNIRHYKQNCHVKKQNLVVVMPKGNVPLKKTVKAHEMILSSQDLDVAYDRKEGTVRFYRKDGTLLFAEKKGSSVLIPVKDGTHDSYRVRQTFQLEPDECIYGLGQLQNGSFNQRGRTYEYMIEANTSVWIPYVRSSKGYALYWDNPSPTTFRDDPISGMSFESAVGDGIDYYFLSGSQRDGDESIREMRSLTGQVPLMPLWSFGYFQSKERYQSAAETAGVVSHYRKIGVPLDCVVQDWQYWGDNNMWNAMEFANPKFANYQQMIDSVHKMNAHLLISVWPNFGKDTKPYQYFKSHGELIRQGKKIVTETYPPHCGVAIYDAYNKDARNAYWRYLYQGIMSKGADAYWLDATEPEHYQKGPDLEEALDFTTGLGCTWRSVRNAYPLVHAGGIYDHHRAEPSLSEKRVMILTRSGFAGMQRYSANVWTGDEIASWKTFANVIPAGLNYTICGLPYWNTDTGAFANGELKGPGHDEYDEFYARWLQFSTFCPMMRSHGAGTDKAIYVWGTKGNKYYDNIEKYISLRYHLLPYIYATAWNVSSKGESFMNALPIAYPLDPNTFHVQDEYLFGKSILVAPVLRYRATSRQVYLPKGSNWVDFWTGEKVDGGKTIQKAVDLSTLPLYVKAGTILPYAKKAMYAQVQDWDTLQVRIYPGANGSFTLYEDEGDSYRYEQGAYSTITFQWDDASGNLSIGERTGNFKGMKRNRVFDIVFVDRQSGLGHQLSDHVTKRVLYDGSRQTVHL